MSSETEDEGLSNETAFSLEKKPATESDVVDRNTDSFGYDPPENVASKDMIELYERDSVVHRRLDKEHQDIFGDRPTINAESEDLEEEIRKTLYERDGLYYKLDEAAKASDFDGVALVYLNLDDRADLKERPKNINDIENIGVIYSKDIVSSNVEQDINDPEYNQVVTWDINEYTIHKDRLIHVVFDQVYRDPYGIPKLLPEFDYHLLRKSILEDGARAFHQNAQGIKLFTPGENANSEDVKWLKNNVKNLRGTGEMTAPAGTSVDHPAPKISDPTPFIDPIMKQGTAMPHQILVGTQAGQVTGSETNLRLYYQEIQNIRQIKLNKWLTEKLTLLQEEGYLPDGDFSLNWGDVLEKADTDKASIFFKKARAITNLVEIGVIDRKEAREELGYEPSTEDTEAEEDVEVFEEVPSFKREYERYDIDFEQAEDKNKLWDDLTDDQLDKLKSEVNVTNDFKLINTYEGKFKAFLSDFQDDYIEKVKDASEAEGETRGLFDKLLRRDRETSYDLEFSSVEDTVAVLADITGLGKQRLQEILRELHTEAYISGYNSVAELHNSPLIQEVTGYAKKWIDNNAILRAQFKADEFNNAIRGITMRKLRDGATVNQLERSLYKELSGYKNNLETLARTEINNAVNNGRISSYKKLGMRKGTILAVADDRTCDECMALDGREFKLEALRNIVPVHPNCRCQVVASKDFRGVNL